VAAFVQPSLAWPRWLAGGLSLIDQKGIPQLIRSTQSSSFKFTTYKHALRPFGIT
jgi:hypothetical protein